MYDSKVYTIPMSGPHDVSGLEALIDSGEIAPSDIQGIMINNEGHLWAKGYCQLAFSLMLAEKTGSSPNEILNTMPFQGIAGVAGLMVPHAAVFVRREAEGEATGEKRLVIAGRCTKEVPYSDYGSVSHITEVGDTVTSLMNEVGVRDPADVRFVFVKGQWCTQEDVDQALARGEQLPTDDAWVMGDLSRGAAALGVGLALGEVSQEAIEGGALLRDQDTVFTRIGQVSSGEERRTNSVVIFANSENSVSQSKVESGVLEDGLDGAGVKDILRKLGFEFDCCPSPRDLERVEYAFLKANSATVPSLWGHRHTMKSDLMLGPHWWMVDKAPVHAVVSSILGTTIMSVASGSEHQATPGHPLLAVVARAG